LSPQTVAVLPFQNQSPDSDQEFFCEGITDDIIFALSRVPGLNVIGHTSVFALNPVSQDVNEMASRLGAGTLVDGSVRKSGKTLKIFAEMIDAATGEVRWAEMYDRTLGDLFTVESEIAESVARVLQMTLAPPISKRLIRGAPNMEAYLLYLKGRYEFNRLSSDGYRKAVEVFTQATTEFPSYASPYAGLADAYAYQAVWGCARPRDVFPLAQEAAAKAIKLDPLLAHAYSAQAAALAFYEWKCDEAVKSARRATELEPSFGFGHHIYGCCQLCRGEREAARDCFERAVVLDPLSVRAHRVLGWDLYLERRPHTAEKWLQAALSLDREPMETRFMLAHVYLSDGRLTPALEQARLCQSDPPDPLALGLLGACLGRLGQRDEAAEIVEKLSRMSEKMWVDPHAITEVHLALENTDLALESIQKSLDERTPSSVFMQLDPEFDQIRSDARFKDLLSRLHA
jgi:serine/threonine-protein kinase